MVIVKSQYFIPSLIYGTSNDFFKMSQRNIQMGLSSVVLGFLGVYFSGELPGVQADGFFFGYNRMV